MGDLIRIDTDSLHNYANRLKKIKNKVITIDNDLNKLNQGVSLTTFSGLEYNKLGKYEYILNCNISYLTLLANDAIAVNDILNKLDPLNYEPPKTIGDYFEEAVEAVIILGENVYLATAQTFSDISALVSYGGALYEPWVIVCSFGKIVAACAVIGSAVITTSVSGGLASPVNIITITYALNEISNSFYDLYDVTMSDGKKVGTKNALKDMLNASGEVLGDKLLDNKEIGLAISNGVYLLGASVGDLDDLFKSSKTIKESGVSVKKAAKETYSYITAESKVTANDILTSGGNNPPEWYFESRKKGINASGDLKIGENVVKVGKSTRKVTENVIEWKNSGEQDEN